MEIERPITRDILEQPGAPALSATSDMPVVETKPDAVSTAAPTPEAEAGTTPAESATAEAAATAAQPEKPSADDTPEAPKAKGVQKRLDELTKQREEANRRAEAADQRLDRALAALEKVTGKPAEETKQQLETEDPEPVRPSRGAYDDVDAYDSAVDEYTGQKAAWVARREVKAARAEYAKEQADKALATEQKKVSDAYLARKAKAAERHPDFEEVATNPEVIIPGIVAQAIVHEELGPELQYYFGKNPDEGKRLLAIENPYLQLVELGLIKASLSRDNAAPAQQTISAAAPPIKPVRTSTADTPPPPAEQSMETYAASVRKRYGYADPQARKQR